jgi:hypothetical protein
MKPFKWMESTIKMKTIYIDEYGWKHMDLKRRAKKI